MTRVVLFLLLMVCTSIYSQTNEKELKLIKSEIKRVLFGNSLEYDSIFNQLNWTLTNDSIYSLEDERKKFINVGISFSDSILNEQIQIKCLFNSKKGKCLKIISNRKDFAHMDMLVNYLVLKKDKSCKSIIADVCTLLKMNYDTLLIPSYLSVISNGENKMFTISLFSYGEQDIAIDLINHNNSYQKHECCKVLLYLKGVDIAFDRVNNCDYTINYLLSINPNKIRHKEYISHYED